MSAKRFRLTRQTREHVWLRWEGYGVERRGLSIRVSVQEFRKQWCVCSIHDALQEPQLYFRLTHTKSVDVRPNND